MIREVRSGFLLVGVGHVIPESEQEIRKIIRREKPEVVCVELCPERYWALMEGGTSGGLPLLLRLMFIFQQRLAKSTGSPAGREMIASVEEAERIGASVLFIDRGLSETVRSLAGIPLRERLLMVVQLLLGVILPPVGRGLEGLTEEGKIERILCEFRRWFPAAYRVLVEERNLIMAERLTPLLASSRRVVCVVGAAHVGGLFEILKSRLGQVWFSVTISTAP